MARPQVDRWWPFNRRRRKDPFVRATHGDLDIVMPPPYDLSPMTQDEARAHVADLVRRLLPDALDAGSREVLNNLINAWADQAVAELDAERDERQAVGELLIGLAREEVARRKPRFDADLAGAIHANTALAVTFEELTGRKPTDVVDPRPPRFDDGPIRSTLGPVDLTDYWSTTDEAAAPHGSGDAAGHRPNGARTTTDGPGLVAGPTMTAASGKEPDDE